MRIQTLIVSTCLLLSTSFGGSFSDFFLTFFSARADRNDDNNNYSIYTTQNLVREDSCNRLHWATQRHPYARLHTLYTIYNYQVKQIISGRDFRRRKTGWQQKTDNMAGLLFRKKKLRLELKESRAGFRFVEMRGRERHNRDFFFLSLFFFFFSQFMYIYFPSPYVPAYLVVYC